MEWEDMPEEICVASISTQDIYDYAVSFLQRDPTKEEFARVIEKLRDDLNSTPDESQVEFATEQRLVMILQHQEYDESKMDMAQLRQKKFCKNCQSIEETYWEIALCDKNPKGESEPPMEHGNDIDGTITCEDEYCNPDYQEVDIEKITPKYVSEHDVYERCRKCDSFMVGL